MFNQVLLAGRVCKDPELFETKEGVKRCKICLVVDRPFKQKGAESYGRDFIYVYVWDGISETIASTCKKNTLVIVRGRLEQNNYIDKDTGKKVYSYSVVGERVCYMGKGFSNNKKDSDDNETDEEQEDLIELEIDPELSTE